MFILGCLFELRITYVRTKLSVYYFGAEVYISINLSLKGANIFLNVWRKVFEFSLFLRRNIPYEMKYRFVSAYNMIHNANQVIPHGSENMSVTVAP